jgi:hypothetical protein
MTHSTGRPVAQRIGARIAVALAVLAAGFLAAGAVVGCSRAPVDPPPPAVQAIYERIREGYRQRNADTFTQDFAEVMFARQGPEGYMDVVDTLKSRFGEWGDEETYLGADNDTHTWRVRLGRNLIRVVIVLDEDDRVQGLWFR